MYPNTADSLSRLTVPDLKILMSYLPGGGSTAGNKANLVAAIERSLLGKDLHAIWDALGPVEKAAVAEAVHDPEGEYDARAFEAKYEARPVFMIQGKSSYSSARATALGLLLHESAETGHRFVPPDLRLRLATWVVKPEPMVMQGQPELAPADGLHIRCTEGDALQDLVVLLHTLGQCRVQVSDKTAVASAAAQRLITDKLSGGDFYPWIAKQNKWDQQVGPIKAFAWPLLLQAGGLAACVSGRLTLSPAGTKALVTPAAQVLRGLWRKWLKTTLIDEFSRIDLIKGQQSAGRVMTAVAPRRQAIDAALRACPVGQWMNVDTLGRFMRASGFDFEVTHDEWKLYIVDKQYGALGYSGFHDWRILQQRYLMVVLMEYAATLGMIDLSYRDPHGARSDFGNNWGTDDLDFLSRYDGLECVRINELGAYVLGLRDSYLPVIQTSSVRLQVWPDLHVSIVHGHLEPGSQMLLEMWANPVDTQTWQLSPSKTITALEKNHDIADLRQFLEAHSDDPLPEEADTFLSRCARNAKALHVVGSATVIDCLDVGVADAITTHKITRSLCLRAGPALLVVRNEHLDKFRAQLRELGWGVVA